MRCPHCKNRLLQKTGETVRVRIEGPVVVDAAGRATARCYWCKTQVPVPLVLELAEPVVEERYVVPRRA